MVESRVSRAIFAFVVAAALAGTACVEIDGGAVELAWTLRDFEDTKKECSKVRIDKVRLCWMAVGEGELPEPECVAARTDAGIDEQFRDFDCVASRGVTRFEVAPGRTSLFIEPLCRDGLPASGPYLVPPPIVRNVESGRVVTLSQLLIMVSSDDCEGTDCTCP